MVDAWEDMAVRAVLTAAWEERAALTAAWEETAVAALRTGLWAELRAGLWAGLMAAALMAAREDLAMGAAEATVEAVATGEKVSPFWKVR